MRKLILLLFISLFLLGGVSAKVEIEFPFSVTQIVTVLTGGNGTLDGNASSICSLGEYLDGSGACNDLNATIDDRVVIGGGDNASWNQSWADTLYDPIGGGVGISNNTDGWNISFRDIFSFDWSNITILENQILDLTHFNATYDSWLSNATTNWTERTRDTYNETWSNTFNATYDALVGGITNSTAGWNLNITELVVSAFLTIDNVLRWNMYDDGSDLILNVTNGGGNFEIMQENSKITLFNSPVVGNDFKVFQIFSKEASDVSEFTITKAGLGRTSYFVRSLSIAGNSTNTPNPFNCTDYANFIDCNTDVTGADLYVQDDIELNGTLFVGEEVNATRWTNVTILESQVTDLTHFNATYDAYQTNVSRNWTSNTFDAFNSIWAMVYTNLAFTNQSNDFIGNQNITGNLNVTGDINSTGSLSVKYNITINDSVFYDNGTHIIWD